MSRLCLVGMLFVCTLSLSCDDDDTEADLLGVGAECTTSDQCTLDEQICLTEFKGGYCGLRDCLSHDDCPDASACVKHSDGISGSSNYCFRICVDKAECNENRSLDNESNCSANIEWVGGEPSSGKKPVCLHQEARRR
ncbi:MAG: hypothetical protein IPJ88_09830 [Myxococcales bacterium]|nr:MAG: hypothetical protein IPJ88_09830 [Myxococcales bacterium]